MATFLTTSKMHPALAARVEASVQGRTQSSKVRRPKLVVAARLAAVTAAVLIVGAIATRCELESSALDQARADLLADVARDRSGLEPKQLQLASRAEALLHEAADATDIVDDSLRSSTRLAEVLSQPAVYVRGERAALRDATRSREAFRESVNDVFLLCLIEPPPATTEKALLAKVQLAYAGGLENHTANVRRLQDAVIGLPFLQRSWLERVEQAPSLTAIGKLRTAFQRAPIENASAAARAEWLIYVFDDPPKAGALVELDGSSRHDVRVGLVHIPSGKPLLRMRDQVDPAWISDANRPEMGRGLTGCRLAVDVREAVSSAE
jgi:hypothetical protein